MEKTYTSKEGSVTLILVIGKWVVLVWDAWTDLKGANTRNVKEEIHISLRRSFILTPNPENYKIIIFI